MSDLLIPYSTPWVLRPSDLGLLSFLCSSCKTKGERKGLAPAPWSHLPQYLRFAEYLDSFSLNSISVAKSSYRSLSLSLFFSLVSLCIVFLYFLTVCFKKRSMNKALLTYSHAYLPLCPSTPFVMSTASLYSSSPWALPLMASPQMWSLSPCPSGSHRRLPKASCCTALIQNTPCLFNSTEYTQIKLDLHSGYTPLEKDRWAS